MQEIERRTVDADEGFPVRTLCHGCTREIVLRFNGGELDRRECCGFVYTLEHGPIDFVVRTHTWEDG